jgi:hypothetical protein
MRKRRRTADDFVRDMKAKQQHSTPGDMERKTCEGQSEGYSADPRRKAASKLIRASSDVRFRG